MMEVSILSEVTTHLTPKKKRKEGVKIYLLPLQDSRVYPPDCPLLFTAVKEGKIKLDRMVELICENPAKIFDLYPKKGTIAVGSDADFVIFNPDKKDIISKDKMFTKCRDSALVYDGWEVYGKPEKTIVRGKVVFDNGEITVSLGYGEIVKVKRN